ncbi:hypothetical protein HYALB_00014095 [Hymenoscyphus albidus]|uniref:Ankyrin n=1 Tax=Hymenoscyphus albidus TaxID=595503 RepID=A0A9N9LZZ3_9HELO|nr:hypothetical protein HYALB_00014095 [Hymenoscyphus albidus]
MATLSKLQHLDAIKQLCSYSSTTKLKSTLKAGPMATLSKLQHLDAIKQLCSCSLTTKLKSTLKAGEYGNALQAAALEGHQAIVQLLLENKADSSYLHPNFADGHRVQTLYIEEIVTMLLNSASKIKSFHSNVQKGHDSAVASALDSGMKPDVPGGWYLYALHTAASQGNLSIIVLLLAKSNAELDIPDFAGRTPLWLAAQSGHVSVLDKLFESGTVDINPRDLEGRSALWQSSARGHLNAVKWLLSRNANHKIPDNYGLSPLEKAEIEGHKSIIEAIRRAP